MNTAPDTFATSDTNALQIWETWENTVPYHDNIQIERKTSVSNNVFFLEEARENRKRKEMEVQAEQSQQDTKECVDDLFYSIRKAMITQLRGYIKGEKVKSEKSIWDQTKDWNTTKNANADRGIVQQELMHLFKRTVHNDSLVQEEKLGDSHPLFREALLLQDSFHELCAVAVFSELSPIITLRKSIEDLQGVIIEKIIQWDAVHKEVAIKKGQPFFDIYEEEILKFFKILQEIEQDHYAESSAPIPEKGNVKLHCVS